MSLFDSGGNESWILVGFAAAGAFFLRMLQIILGGYRPTKQAMDKTAKAAEEAARCAKTAATNAKKAQETAEETDRKVEELRRQNDNLWERVRSDAEVVREVGRRTAENERRHNDLLNDLSRHPDVSRRPGPHLEEEPAPYQFRLIEGNGG